MILPHLNFHSYSPCPNLEGIKDVFCDKFGMFRIGQICRACAQARVAIEIHSRVRGVKCPAFARSAEQAIQLGCTCPILQEFVFHRKYLVASRLL